LWPRFTDQEPLACKNAASKKRIAYKRLAKQANKI